MIAGAYLWHKRQFQPLTRDHSLVEAQVDAGLLTSDESLQAEEQNVLLRVLGREPTVEVELTEVPVEPGDYLLLCTDGLTRTVADSDMAEAIATVREPQRICDHLVDTANRSGGPDNITVLVVEDRGELVAAVVEPLAGTSPEEINMAKLILKYEDRALQEFAIGAEEVQIGRLPDNTVVIDNPAVSSRHAAVMRVGESYVLKDLASTNGTFVNDERITERFLHDGDVMQVGKHSILFINQPETPKPLPDLGGTVFLDTEAQRGLLAKSPPQPAAAGRPPRACPPRTRGANRARRDHG